MHKELQKDGTTLNLLWLYCCEVCLANGELQYQSTQFNKYYNDYLIKKSATMHLSHKPGKIMQVDWAVDTATVIATDTCEDNHAYNFIATPPYIGYGCVKAFISISQECWITAHANAYKYSGGVAKII